MIALRWPRAVQEQQLPPTLPMGPSSIWFRSGVAAPIGAVWLPSTWSPLRTKLAFRRSLLPSRYSLILAGLFMSHPCLRHLKIVVTLRPVCLATFLTRAIVLDVFIRLGLRHNRANLTELPAAGKFPEPEPLTVSAPNVRMFIAIQCYKNFSPGASKETLLPEPRKAPGVALEDSLDPLGGCPERVAIDPRWPLGSLCSRA
jgi:hypothetical protein